MKKWTDKAIAYFYKNKVGAILIGFALIALAVILIATIGMKEGIVPVCVLIILQTVIARLVTKSELWIHGIVVAVELLTGLIIKRFWLMLMLVIIYAAATYVLKDKCNNRCKNNCQDNC